MVIRRKVCFYSIPTHTNLVKKYFQMQMVKENKVAGAFLMYVSDDDFDGRACKCGKFHLLRTMNEALRGASDESCVPALCP